MKHSIEPSAEIKAIIGRWMGAMSNQDGQTLTALLSQSDSLMYVGSDFEEVFEGELFRSGYSRHIAAMPAFEAVTDRIEAFTRGDVGWALWLGKLHFKERDARFPYRISFVLCLESGIWKIAHAHVSTPRTNLEVIGTEHTIFQQLMEAARAEGQGAESGVEGTATIMFTDVANSTSIAAFVGDRTWAKVIEGHLADVGHGIEKHGGRVVKTLGDGTMASFPSARAAIQAALAIQDHVSETRTEPELHLRVGLHTGDVVQAGGDFFGSVVNKAARIAAIAEPGSILVSEATRSAAEGATEIDFAPPRSVTLRGVEGEHLVSRVLARSR